MKVEIVSTTQAWFLLSVLGPDAIKFLQNLSATELEAIGKMIVWLGKSKKTTAPAAAPAPAPEAPPA